MDSYAEEMKGKTIYGTVKCDCMACYYETMVNNVNKFMFVLGWNMCNFCTMIGYLLVHVRMEFMFLHVAWTGYVLEYNGW